MDWEHWDESGSMQQPNFNQQWSNDATRMGGGIGGGTWGEGIIQVNPVQQQQYGFAPPVYQNWAMPIMGEYQVGQSLIPNTPYPLSQWWEGDGGSQSRKKGGRKAQNATYSSQMPQLPQQGYNGGIHLKRMEPPQDQMHSLGWQTEGAIMPERSALMGKGGRAMYHQAEQSGMAMDKGCWTQQAQEWPPLQTQPNTSDWQWGQEGGTNRGSGHWTPTIERALFEPEISMWEGGIAGEEKGERKGRTKLTNKPITREEVTGKGRPKYQMMMSKQQKSAGKDQRYGCSLAGGNQQYGKETNMGGMLTDERQELAVLNPQGFGTEPWDKTLYGPWNPDHRAADRDSSGVTYEQQTEETSPPQGPNGMEAFPPLSRALQYEHQGKKGIKVGKRGTYTQSWREGMFDAEQKEGPPGKSRTFLEVAQTSNISRHTRNNDTSQDAQWQTFSTPWRPIPAPKTQMGGQKNPKGLGKQMHEAASNKVWENDPWIKGKGNGESLQMIQSGKEQEQKEIAKLQEKVKELQAQLIEKPQADDWSPSIKGLQKGRKQQKTPTRPIQTRNRFWPLREGGNSADGKGSNPAKTRRSLTNRGTWMADHRVKGRTMTGNQKENDTCEKG